MLDNVSLPCRFSTDKQEKIRALGSSPTLEALRLLDQLGIDNDLLGKPVTELSVGQQQRVAAARALMGAPELIIADEPTSSLDAEVQEAFIRLLFKECTEQGTTLVFVSHDQRFAPLFDRSMRFRKAADSASFEIEEGGVL